MADTLGIAVVPLHVRFGTDELVDREQLSVAQFWERCAASADLPETAAPSPGAFKAAFEALLGQGADGVVCVTLSSKLSATNEAASQAARAMDDPAAVTVLDSFSVTMGQGLVAMAAAEAAAEGSEHGAGTGRGRLGSSAPDRLRRHRHPRKPTPGGKDRRRSRRPWDPAVHQARHRGARGVVEQESKQRTRAKSLNYLAQKVRSARPLERSGRGQRPGSRLRRVPRAPS